MNLSKSFNIQRGIGEDVPTTGIEDMNLRSSVAVWRQMLMKSAAFGVILRENSHLSDGGHFGPPRADFWGSGEQSWDTLGGLWGHFGSPWVALRDSGTLRGYFGDRIVPEHRFS